MGGVAVAVRLNVELANWVNLSFKRPAAAWRHSVLPVPER